MAKKDGAIEVEGSAVEALPNAALRVGLSNRHIVLAHISRKIRQHYIRIFPGDRVVVELSLCDLFRGRIVYRYKQHVGSRSRRRNITKVKPSVRKTCDSCKVIRRHGYVVVVYENPWRKQCQG